MIDNNYLYQNNTCTESPWALLRYARGNMRKGKSNLNREPVQKNSDLSTYVGIWTWTF